MVSPKTSGLKTYSTNPIIDGVEQGYFQRDGHNIAKFIRANLSTARPYQTGDDIDGGGHKGIKGLDDPRFIGHKPNHKGIPEACFEYTLTWRKLDPETKAWIPCSAIVTEQPSLENQREKNTNASKIKGLLV